MASRKYSYIKQRKIFLNCMNSWFSNFIIEEFRTDYLPNANPQNVFMGTIDINGHPLPRLFEPTEITVQPDVNYNNQKVFENDIIIYNLDDANLSEVEFVIRGLKNLKYEKEKILIIISNIMTWAKTPLKTFTEDERASPDFHEEEVPEIKEEEIKKVEIRPQPEPEKVEEIKPKEEKKKEKASKGKGKGKKGKKSKGKDKEKDKEKTDKKTKDKGKKGKSKEKISPEKKEKEKVEEEKKNIEKVQKEQEKDQAKVAQKTTDTESKKTLPKIKTYYYRESEYIKRIPSSRYSSYKMLENLALSNTNPMLNVYVICPGFIYGCGEDFFFDYFRKAWIGGIPHMPIIGEGMNFLPTIHILDLVQIIRRIIEKKPIINYIFACDKTKNPTMKNIIRSISKGIGSIDIKNLNEFDIDEIDMPNFNELSIDIQIKSSKVTENDFKWHCEKGIPDNMDLLRQEFNLYRGIKPLKIIISGPPCGGKTYIAKKIANQFKILHLTIPDIITWAQNLKNNLGEEMKRKMRENEEKVAVAQEEYDKRKNKKKSDPPFDPTPYRKFDSEFIGKLLKEKIRGGECAGKGYVLDNYPKTYQDCLNVFAIAHKKRIKKENPEENSKENNEEDEYIETIEYEIIKDLLPDSVIMIKNYTEESLKNKLMLNPEYEEKQQEIDSRFSRRLKYFKENNENPAEPNIKTLETFYKENNIQIHYVNETEFMKNQELENIKILYYLERYGDIDNFSKLQDEEEIMPFKEQENLEENNEEKNLMENNEIVVKKEKKEEPFNINLNKIKERLIDEECLEPDIEDENDKEIREIEEKEEKKKKIGINSLNEMLTKQEIFDNNIKSKLNELKEKEKILLEKKSEVMRRYLNEKVMPLLAKGILNICENVPDDPVEALANFILDNNYNFSNNMNDSVEINGKH